MHKVLDSWAVIQWLKGIGPGHTHVAVLLARAEAGSVQLFASMINVGEIFYVLAKRHSRAEAETFLERVLPGMPIEVVIPDRQLIVDAALWKANENISYADGFALATAVRVKAHVVTGDPEMRDLGSHLIDWIGS